MNETLGICIPTYNRAKTLRRNLENLVDRVAKYQIPIYISDNNSEDETEAVANEIKNIYPYLTYWKNSENIGPARNFEKVLSRCETKYAWLLSDDDTITGDIQPVLDVLEKDSWDLFVFGVSEKYGGSREYRDINRAFTDLLGAMIWISALIFNREIVNKVIEQGCKNPHFAHAGALLEVLDENSSIYYFFDQEKQIVKAMSNELVDWADRAFEIFSGKWIDFVLSLPDRFSLEEKKEAIKGLPSSPWRWRILLLYRAKGFYNVPRLLKQKDKIWFVSKLHFMVMLFIALLPKFAASLIINSGLLAKRMMRGMTGLIRK